MTAPDGFALCQLIYNWCQANKTTQGLHASYIRGSLTDAVAKALVPPYISISPILDGDVYPKLATDTDKHVSGVQALIATTTEKAAYAIADALIAGVKGTSAAVAGGRPTRGLYMRQGGRYPLPYDPLSDASRFHQVVVQLWQDEIVD